VSGAFPIVPGLFWDRKMVIEAILFVVFVTAVGVAIVKISEWRFGPYLPNKHSEQNRPR
jgi:hypothetical protein